MGTLYIETCSAHAWNYVRWLLFGSARRLNLALFFVGGSCCYICEGRSTVWRIWWCNVCGVSLWRGGGGVRFLVRNCLVKFVGEVKVRRECVDESEG